jgi:hypothetical protein
MLWELVAVQANPMKLVKIPGATKREDEPRVLTVEEFNKFLAQIEKEPYRTMVIPAMCLGLRCSELIGLPWQDFDWDNLTLLVRRAVVASHVDRVKTRYSKKNLPLDAGLAENPIVVVSPDCIPRPGGLGLRKSFHGRATALSVLGHSATASQSGRNQGRTGSDRMARFAPYLPDALGRGRRSNLCPTGAYAACGHWNRDEHLWRFGGGEPAESQQQGREPLAQQEDRLMERNLGSSSISGLLDLFWTCGTLDLTDSTKELAERVGLCSRQIQKSQQQWKNRSIPLQSQTLLELLP